MMVARAHTSTEAFTQGKDRETLFLVTWDKSFWGGVSVFGGRHCCMCLGLGGVVSVDGASVHLSSSISPDGGWVRSGGDSTTRLFPYSWLLVYMHRVKPLLIIY